MLLKQKVVFILVILGSWTNSWAQVMNDSCFQAIDLGIMPLCDTTRYANTGALPDTLTNPPFCLQDTSATGDVWFSLYFPDTSDYQISILPALEDTMHISWIEFTMLNGTCDSLTFSACSIASDSLATASLVFKPDSIGYYFLLVSNRGLSSNEGSFKICVDTIPDFNTIDEGGSTDCSGILYDSGGPNGNYSANESFVYTICPDQPHGCISLTLDYFDLEVTDGITQIGDLLLFYDGDDVNDPLIGNIGYDSLILVNQGGSGVCYAVTAHECLTIQFISDDAINLSGFQAHWECSTEGCPEIPTLEITDTLSYATIEEALSSTFVDVKIDTIICTQGSYGTFIAPKSTGLGIERGIVLTTGKPSNALGPNINNQFIGSNLMAPGDADLDSISVLYENGAFSVDACIVEMDVTAYDNELSFEYIFGSEEYTYYVDNVFNDIFALLISGPDITDGIPQIGGQKNMALIPGTQDFVAINSVNNLQNWEYFRNTNNSKSIGYNGLTSDYLGSKKSLTARQVVTPCSSYHLKFAIADRFDGSYDSGVFISEINSGEPTLSFFSNEGFSFLSEGCSGDQDVITVSLPYPVTDTTQFNVLFGGTADPETDFLFSLADSIIFYPGDSVLHFPIQVIPDTLVEGTETLTLTLVNELACKTVVLATLEINIYDEVDIFITVETDSMLICPKLPLELSAVGAQEYLWSPDSLFLDPSLSTVSILPLENDTWVYVTGQIMGSNGSLCSDIDSIFLQLADTLFSIMPTDSMILCNQDSMWISIEGNNNNLDISWNNPIETIRNDSFFIVLLPGNNALTLIATTGLSGCPLTDTLIVLREIYEIPKLTTLDTTICQGASIMLASAVSDVFSTYEWSPSTFLDNPNIAHATSTPTDNIKYILKVSSSHLLCQEEFIVDIDVIRNFVRFNQTDNIQICQGEAVTLDITSSTGGVGVKWTSDVYDIDTSQISSFTFFPDQNGEVYVKLSALGCMSTDTISIIVDSLPNIELIAVPDQLKYCPNSLISIGAEFANPDDFPNASYQWTFNDAILDFSDSSENPFVDIMVTESTTFYRSTLNGSCSTEDSIKIVVPEIDYILVSDVTSTCFGNPVQLDIATFNQITDISWTDASTLSCDDCRNPIAEPAVTTTYYFSALMEDCPVNDSITITVTNEVLTILPDTSFFCTQNADLVTLQLSGSSLISDVVWSTQVDCLNPSCTLVEVDPTSISTISAEASFTSGCIASDEAIMLPYIMPVFSLDVSPSTSLAIGQEVSVTAMITPSNPSLQSLSWTVNGQAVANNFGFLDIILNDETTTVSVILTDGNGCQQTAEVVITADIPTVVMPKMFFPQGQEDLNRTFSFLLTLQGERIAAEGILKVQAFRVFNRWGEMVFDCDNVACAETGWNGIFKDKPAPSEVYIYYFEAIDFRGENIFLEGDVTLMR